MCSEQSTPQCGGCGLVIFNSYKYSMFCSELCKKELLVKQEGMGISASLCCFGFAVLGKTVKEF